MATDSSITPEHNSDGLNGIDHEKATAHMSHEERETAKKAARFGYGPLAQLRSGGAGGGGGGAGNTYAAFGGEFQPGLFRGVETRKFANPAPLGLSAFALTTFVLSLINVGARGISAPNIVVGLAFAYGGLVQLLAGMWEMAVGNTFGATALSSYGGFWIAVGITLTPGGFEIVSSIETANGGIGFYDCFGFFLMGWFIFTTILLICTLKSTVAFFFLFFTLDLAFLFLGIGYLHNGSGAPNTSCIKAGGYFGLFAAFLAWYNALAGIADTSNSFFIIPVAHFPWSAKAMERKAEKTEHTV